LYWKLAGRSQITGLIVMAILTLAGAAMAGKDRVKAVDIYDKKIKEKSSTLDSIKTELHKGRSRISELQKQEGTYLAQIEQVEKNIFVSRSYLQEITDEIDSVDHRIGILRVSLDSATQALRQRQTTMRRRLRTMYKAGSPDLVRLLLTSGSVIDMLNRSRYFLELKHYDQALVAAIDSTKNFIISQSYALESEKTRLLALKSDKVAEQTAFEREKESRGVLLTSVQQEKAAFVAMVKELEQAQRELDLLLKTLAKQRAKAKTDSERILSTVFEKRKGVLPWPVEGTIVKDFGKIVHPVYKTVTMSIGVDIETGMGESVSCVAPGRVEYVGWMRGYGQFVIVNHPGGYLTIYAHLNSILVQKDQDLQDGDLIGSVGDTGSLEGARLHFQVRKSTDPLDPRLWLGKKTGVK
jgi:septal ring factor EnvC (AmiA/AmiB activator)